MLLNDPTLPSSYNFLWSWDSSQSFHGFTYADWANNINDNKSTSGDLIYLGSTPIS